MTCTCRAGGTIGDWAIGLAGDGGAVTEVVDPTGTPGLNGDEALLDEPWLVDRTVPVVLEMDWLDEAWTISGGTASSPSVSIA
jgi:hypothetical protein